MPKGIKGFQKGQKFSEEHKRKLSNSHKGKRLSPDTEFKEGLIPWNKGTTGLMNPWNKGIKGICKPNSGSFKQGDKVNHSFETKIKIGMSKVGSRNPMWKGGITKEHELIRHSAIYRSWRLGVFRRDDFTCQNQGCGVRGSTLNAHHVKEFSKYPELRLDINNGITLCKSCHKKIGATGNN
jgi:hypothetical protein